MAASVVTLLLFSLAAASALPQEKNAINWPDRPSFWPETLPWPPSSADGWPDRPDWWPFPTWPPPIPDEWPEEPAWWPEQLPWPPGLPEDRPEWWPESLPWPPAKPEGWPDQPDWWPENLPWPPAKPEDWPDRPEWWPESLPWPPAFPEEWPDQPEWWPDLLPWPPGLPDLDAIWPPPDAIIDNIPYVPSRDNEFHLFTRANPAASQPLVFNNPDILRNSNYDASKRTVVLVHGARSSAIGTANAIVIPAYLAAADVNIIAVDWSRGAWESSVLTTIYSVLSGNFIARFINFVQFAAGGEGDLANFHLIGHGLGALNVGFIGLRLNREVGYITALDPSGGSDFFRILPPLSINAGGYFESIHTDVAQDGLPQQLAQVSFYPNGGEYQPGCGGDSDCNRNRAVYFFAESIQSGGFSGVQCGGWRDAIQGNCHGPGSLNLGGLEPKTGSRGVFYLRTNSLPPFSLG